MSRNNGLLVLALAAVVLGWAVPVACADEALDKAFDALKTYDWGQERGALKPIDDAVAASNKDAAAKKALETRLAGLLATDVSRASKDFVCRQLSLIGSAQCVPAVAPLLTDEKLSHMARYALERIPAPEAVKAMRDSLPKTKGRVKVGVINSLGVRRDVESSDALAALSAPPRRPKSWQPSRPAPPSRSNWRPPTPSSLAQSGSWPTARTTTPRRSIRA